MLPALDFHGIVPCVTPLYTSISWQQLASAKRVALIKKDH